MEIQLNGQSRIVEAGTRLSDLLRSEGLAERRVAIEVNGEIVPRGLHASQCLQAGDRIEIVHALGGG
jgi:sulfur carrier protein